MRSAPLEGEIDSPDLVGECRFVTGSPRRLRRFRRVPLRSSIHYVASLKMLLKIASRAMRFRRQGHHAVSIGAPRRDPGIFLKIVPAFGSGSHCKIGQLDRTWMTSRTEIR